MHKFGKAELLSNEQLHIWGWLTESQTHLSCRDMFYGGGGGKGRYHRLKENHRRKCWCEFTNIRRHQTHPVVFPQIISRLTYTVRNKFMNGPKFLVLVNVGCTLMWCYRKMNAPATLSTWVSTAMPFKCTTCTVASFRHRYASSTVATFPNALAIWFIDRLSALPLQNLCVLVTCLVGRTQIHVDVYYGCQYCSTWCTAFTAV